ncbi:MAG: ATP-binding protein [Deltaproteobacteria bacterium]|nr:ATP-binding protein [Deltaproteobacteria bacterium]MBW1816289.1 ATP-binding protein [Deltaproteobacteria bacterium]MBW2283737.1 ATP-binding protein [Deltaproteobacteria bacterium]
MEIERQLQLAPLLEKKSFFLFGPRATGKTTLIRQQLAKTATVIDLLDSRYFLDLSANPNELAALIAAAPTDIVVIDEIQRIPELLNEVHRLIETRGITFLLTGSSARKLRRGKANLLAGRVWDARMFPLIYREIPDFDLDRYLRYGGMPAVYLSNYPEEELDAYVNTYLKEEIMAEGLIRRLPPFSRFLRSIALANGEMINFTKLANDCQVPPSTVTEYVGILEDTLVGFLLPAWTASKKRKAIKTGKFYFFDPGVTHMLAGTESLDRNSDLYGKSFEQFIAMELRAYLSYRRKKLPLAYWRSKNGHEVDFLLGAKTAIEVKASKRVTRNDLKGLTYLREEGVFQHFVLVSQDPVSARTNDILTLPWNKFLAGLWKDEFA